MRRLAILIVEPDLEIRRMLERSCPPEVQAFGTRSSEVTWLARERSPKLIILGPSYASANGLKEHVEHFGAFGVPLLLVAMESSEELAIMALRARISDYLKYPWRPEEFREALERCMQNRPPEQTGFDTTEASSNQMLGESQCMRRIKEYLARAARSDSTILITGETGTGKELAAEFLHRESLRRNRPFITINCAAVPDSLLESELFGYEQGAFTGAHSSQDGKMKAANRGTVFFDEIGDMTLFAQAKVLRAIEGKGIQKLGRVSTVPIDVRIVAATNCEIEKLVAEDKFRKDLYYRLNVARIHLPPLRERKDDLPQIVGYYVQLFSRRFGREMPRLTQQAWDFIFNYDWPGNIRELKNFLEACCMQGSSPEISPEQFPLWLRQLSRTARAGSRDEHSEILSALLATNWNKSKAAEKLNWSRMTLYRKIAKYGVSKSAKATV